MPAWGPGAGAVQALPSHLQALFGSGAFAAGGPRARTAAEGVADRLAQSPGISARSPMIRAADLARGRPFVHDRAHRDPAPGSGRTGLPDKRIAVTPLFCFPLCPNRNDARTDPCYVLCMLRHDGSTDPPQWRSWWLVEFSTLDDAPLTPPWLRDTRAHAASDVEGTGSLRRRGGPAVNAPGG